MLFSRDWLAEDIEEVKSALEMLFAGLKIPSLKYRVIGQR